MRHSVVICCSSERDANDCLAGREVDSVLVGVVCRISRHFIARRRRMRLVHQSKRRLAGFIGVRLQRGDDSLGDYTPQRWSHQPGCHHWILGHAQD